MVANGVTVTAAVPLAEPEVAVMIAAPAISVATIISPEDETVTVGDDELHVTLAPVIGAPNWFLTVAVSCRVVPKPSKLRILGDMTTEVAIGVGGSAGSELVGVSQPSPPHAASSSSAISRENLILVRCSRPIEIRQIRRLLIPSVAFTLAAPEAGLVAVLPPSAPRGPSSS